MWLWITTACLLKLPVAPPLANAPAPFGGPWETAVFADQDLVGRIWDVRRARFATEDDLLADLRTVDVVLLGEKHDNPDHHRLQARLVQELLPASCVLEMLDDGDPIAPATTSAELAALSQWDSSGWPSFSLYAPVVEACYAAKARIDAGHPTRLQLSTARSGGLAALGPEVTAGLPPLNLDEAARSALASTITAAHCGQLPPESTEPMVQMQMTKDAGMSRALLRSQRPTVLIAGTGHADTLYGVPRYLDRPSRSVLWVEVREGVTDPRSYDESRGDWLWFTPRVDDLDPCAAFSTP
jgi:uncharacterized iron-regulated protein